MTNKFSAANQASVTTPYKAFMLAAPQTGGGKTSLSLAFMYAFKKLGFKVQPFKCGPDFVDPVWHSRACQRTSFNLDPWIMGDAACVSLFNEQIANSGQAPLDCNSSNFSSSNFNSAEQESAPNIAPNIRLDSGLNSGLGSIALVEAVMGLFDGIAGGAKQGKAPLGSSAYLAKLLNIPIVLTVDAGAQGHSIAALVKGFIDFDPELNIVGVIVNKVASLKHAKIIREALCSYCPRVPLLALLPKSEDIKVESRHLGLCLDIEKDANYFERLLSWLEQGFAEESSSLLSFLSSLPEPRDFEPTFEPVQCMQEASSLCSVEPQSCSAGIKNHKHATNQTTSPKLPQELPPKAPAKLSKPRIGVAKDEAFCFHYASNYYALTQAGAELVFFSPLHDNKMPDDLDGLLLGGGYPELYAQALSQNFAFISSLQSFCELDKPIWAEGGGFLYLSNGFEDTNGIFYPMLAHFNLTARIEKKRQGLGYLQAKFLEDNPMALKGQLLRGHVFHYASIIESTLPAGLNPLYQAFNNNAEPLEDNINSTGCLKAKSQSAGTFLHLMLTTGDPVTRRFIVACLHNKKYL